MKANYSILVLIFLSIISLSRQQFLSEENQELEILVDDMNSMDIVKSTRPQHFIEGFMRSIYGPNWKIEEKCLGENIKEDILKAVEALARFKFTEVMEILEEIKQDFIDNCPKSELREIFSDAQSAKNNGTMMKNILRHLPLLNKLVSKLLLANNPESRGFFFGKTVKVMVYGIY